MADICPRCLGSLAHIGGEPARCSCLQGRPGPPSAEGTLLPVADASQRSKPTAGDVAIGGTVAVFTGGWMLVKAAFVVLGLILLIGGFAYSHNSEFKDQCAIHKAGGPGLPFPKNLICALDFQIDNNQ